jgi:hypothetical protein
LAAKIAERHFTYVLLDLSSSVEVGVEAEEAAKKPPATRLQTNPDSTAPVAVPFVLAPPVVPAFVVSPLPIIGMNIEPDFGAIISSRLGVPAVTFCVANNLGRGSGGSKSERACTH